MPAKRVLAALLVGASAVVSQTFTYGSAASQDPLAACRDLQVLNNGEFYADVCADGGLVLDPWLVNSIRFQYNLTRARSWRWGPILGTHNGFISRANGFGLTEDLASALYARTGSVASTHVRVPNQRFGPTTLLDLGVRELELDMWDTLVNDKDFEVVVCHSPVPDPAAVIALQGAADALGMGPLKYNPFTELCSNHTVEWAFTKVADWLAAHPDDVAEVFLDNRVASWNIDLVTAAMKRVFGPTQLTPPILAARFNGTFPSRDAMLAAGLRVIVESNSYVGNNYSQSEFPTVAFWPTTWTAQPGPADLVPYPNCTFGGSAAWYGHGLPRMLDGGDLAFDPQSEAIHSVLLKPVGLADAVACGVNNIGLADVTPAALTGAVWSWAAGQPAREGCAAMTLVRGQWTAESCAEPRRAVCRAGDARVPAGASPELWQLTPAAVPFAGAPAECAALGPGWAFDVPRDGRENALIAQRLLLEGAWGAAVTPGDPHGVWLNVRV